MELFDRLCHTEFAKETLTPSDGNGFLDSVDAKLEAGHNSTNAELEDEFKDKSTADLQSDLKRTKTHLRNGSLPNPEKVRERAARMRSELERREMQSKAWLAKVGAHLKGSPSPKG